MTRFTIAAEKGLRMAGHRRVMAAPDCERTACRRVAAAALALACTLGANARAQVETAEEVEEVRAVEQVEIETLDEDAPALETPVAEPGAEPLPPVPMGGPAYDALGAPELAGEVPGVSVEIYGGGGASASELVHVPVIRHLYPGMVEVRPTIRNPVADDPEAVHRGMQYFNQFNCIGCHAPNGAGGMGPSLSNHAFIYGREPENIYLSILQGRPGGMPPWGGALPDHVIWDLVTYIRSISKDETGDWGARISVDGYKIEQVPAEYMSTVDPWQYTTPFSYGQAPFEKPKGSPPLETPVETLPPK